MSNPHTDPDDRESCPTTRWLYTPGQPTDPPPEGLHVTRTGHVFSVASSEYAVRFPDGTTATIWSPPWHDFTPEQEDAGALAYALALWKTKQAKTDSR